MSVVVLYGQCDACGERDKRLHTLTDDTCTCDQCRREDDQSHGHCRTCSGTGDIDGEICLRCHGSGDEASVMAAGWFGG